jgi:hypothetical protein
MGSSAPGVTMDRGLYGTFGRRQPGQLGAERNCCKVNWCSNDCSDASHAPPQNELCRVLSDVESDLLAPWAARDMVKLLTLCQGRLLYNEDLLRALQRYSYAVAFIRLLPSCSPLCWISSWDASSLLTQSHASFVMEARSVPDPVVTVELISREAGLGRHLKQGHACLCHRHFLRVRDEMCVSEGLSSMPDIGFGLTMFLGPAPELVDYVVSLLVCAMPCLPSLRIRALSIGRPGFGKARANDHGPGPGPGPGHACSATASGWPPSSGHCG